jgi:hypothetical protein
LRNKVRNLKVLQFDRAYVLCYKQTNVKGTCRYRDIPSSRKECNIYIVTYNHTLTGGTKLDELDPATRSSEIIKAANGLKVPPYKVEERLTEGKMVIYHPRRERE